MKMNKLVAERVVHLVMEGVDTLCASASLVRENCDALFFENYQRVLAVEIAGIGDNILEPIFKEYPELRPWTNDGQASSTIESTD